MTLGLSIHPEPTTIKTIKFFSESKTVCVVNILFACNHFVGCMSGIAKLYSLLLTLFRI